MRYQELPPIRWGHEPTRDELEREEFFDRVTRWWLVLMRLALAVLVAGACIQGRDAFAEVPPDVLVVVLDDVGVSDLAAVPTPAIDAFAAESAVFLRANTTSSVCSPSRCILTGLWGRRVGIGRIVSAGDPHDLDPDVTTLADRLEASHATAAFGKWHLRSGAGGPIETGPGDSGFETWRAISAFNLHVPLASGFGNGHYTRWDRIDDGVLMETTEYATAAQVDACATWWNETPGPRFAWLAFNAAHSPFQQPPAIYLPPVPPGPPQIAPDRVLYERTIQALDNRLAHLFASIDTSNAFVFVWADNGTPSEVPGPGQDPSKLKGSMYQGGVESAFFVRGPGVMPGVRRRLISTLDIHDTVLEICGQSPATDDSVSFADELGPWYGEHARRWTFAERYGPNGFGPQTSRERMLRDRADWKLIVHEQNGIETFRALYRLPDELTPVFDAAKELELQAVMDGI